jgi:hypothetical protein
MCFNKEFTLAFSASSCAIAAWILYGRGIWKIARWRRLRLASCFLWFGFMEFLQFIQYLVLGECENPINIFWTAVGFVHIAFQPLFSNLAFSALDPRNVEKKRDHPWNFLRNWCFVSGVLFASRIIIPFFVEPKDQALSALDLCTEDIEGICGPKTCATKGVFHLQWTFRTIKPGYALPGLALHFMNMFVAPIILGQKLGSVVLFCTGPGLSLLFPGAKDGEKAAIWCFFSIAESFITMMTQYAALRVGAKEGKKVVEVERTKSAEVPKKKSK